MIRIKQKLVHIFFLALLLTMLAVAAVGPSANQAAGFRAEQINPPQLIACSTGSNGSCGGG